MPTMDFKHAFSALEQNEEYRGWRKMHPESFLSYALKTMDDHGEQPWHFGFFNEKTDKMITFLFYQNSLEIQPEEAVFKSPGTKVNRIDMKKMLLPFSDILRSIGLLLKDHYTKETITKKIFILQNLEPHGTIWNVTLLSRNLNAINMKVDPENGSILQHKSENLMNFVKKE